MSGKKYTVMRSEDSDISGIVNQVREKRNKATLEGIKVTANRGKKFLFDVASLSLAVKALMLPNVDVPMFNWYLPVWKVFAAVIIFVVFHERGIDALRGAFQGFKATYAKE